VERMALRLDDIEVQTSKTNELDRPRGEDE
jgi:hypothetical protein